MGKRLDSIVKCYVMDRRGDEYYVSDLAGQFEEGPMTAEEAGKMVRTLNTIDGTDQPQRTRRVESVR